MRLWHAIFFLLALVVFAAILAPASFVPQQPGAFTYQRAHGSVWDGRYEGVVIGHYDAGVVSARVVPLRLLAGAIATEAEFSGAGLAGDVSVERGFGGRQAIRVHALTLAGIPWTPWFAPPVETTVRDLEIVFGGGRCRSARGALETDLLQRSQTWLRWEGPPMRGSAACQGETAQLQMSSENTNGDVVSLQLVLHPHGAGEWRMTVRTVRDDAALALQSAGFIAGSTAQEWMNTGDFRWSPL